MKKLLSLNKYVILIVFACLFISVGYAAIANVNLNIVGDAEANAPIGVYITDVNCPVTKGEDFTLNGVVGTMMNSTVYLEDNSNAVHCTITVYNNSDDDYKYDQAIYDEDDFFYDNDDILFQEDITQGTSLSPYNSLTFHVDFFFDPNINTYTNHYLNSFIYFKFVKEELSPIWYENCSKGLDTIRCKIINSSTPYADNVSSPNVSSSSGINFSAISSSTNGRGLYYVGDSSKTEDLDGDGEGDKVYYFRGNVTNNYLYYSGYCWRIVRINEDGSVRVIYGGTMSNGSCPQTGSSVALERGVAFNSGASSTRDNAYVGYMYGRTGQSSYSATHSNDNDSTIKGTVDNWYQTNLSSNAAYLADYRFCADRTMYSGNGYGTSTTYYMPYNRLYTNTSNAIPSTICPQKNDRFSVSVDNGNGALKYPISLLTADEANYAGLKYVSGNSAATNSDCFLYSASNYWLLSPGYASRNTIYGFIVNTKGNLARLNVSSTSTSNVSIYMRPVINIIGNSKWADGEGTYNNPYTISGFSVDTGNGSGGGDTPPGPDPPTPSQLWYENCTNNATRLNCKMITTDTPSSDSSITFTSYSSSSNGRGLYYISDTSKTADLNNDGDGERVFYYRGAVTDNFVLLGNYCWRILRTNEDGTVRLIYGGTPTSGSCPQNGTAVSIGTGAFNSSGGYHAYVGYMYGTANSNSYATTHANTNNSTIKTTIDNWYRNNFTAYASYLADEFFCNDRSLYSGNGYGSATTSTSSNTVYRGYNRINSYDVDPTLICTNANDKFTVNSSNGNGALSYPIGLISADELVYAGSTYNTSSTTTDHFLYMSNTGMWTMTPADDYSNYVFVLQMYTGGNIRLSNNVTYTGYAIRPVINLLDTVVVSSGTGTYDSPYQLSLPS